MDMDMDTPASLETREERPPFPPPLRLRRETPTFPPAQGGSAPLGQPPVGREKSAAAPTMTKRRPIAWAAETSAGAGMDSLSALGGGHNLSAALDSLLSRLPTGCTLSAVLRLPTPAPAHNQGFQFPHEKASASYRGDNETNAALQDGRRKIGGATACAEGKEGTDRRVYLIWLCPTPNTVLTCKHEKTPPLLPTVRGVVIFSCCVADDKPILHTKPLCSKPSKPCSVLRFPL